jgi:hypothetical protein
MTLHEWYLLFAANTPETQYVSTTFPTDADLIAYLELAMQFNLYFCVPTICLRLCMVMDAAAICDNVSSVDALKLIVKGRAQLLGDKESTLHAWIYNDDEPNESRCRMDRLRLARTVSKFDHSCTQVLQPIETYVEDLRLAYPNICYSCMYELKDNYYDSCQRLWDALPGYFSCENWEALMQQYETGTSWSVSCMQLAHEHVSEI